MFLLEHSGVYASSQTEAAYLLLLTLACINCWLLYLYSCLLTRRYFSKSTVVEGIQRLLGKHKGEALHPFLFSLWLVAVLDCSHTACSLQKTYCTVNMVHLFPSGTLILTTRFVCFNGSRVFVVRGFFFQVVCLHDTQGMKKNVTYLMKIHEENSWNFAQTMA